MKNCRALPLFTVLVFAVLVFGLIQAVAGGVKVIANLNVRVDSMTVAELRSVFLEEQRSVRGSHVEPVLVASGDAHESFLRQFIGRPTTRCAPTIASSCLSVPVSCLKFWPPMATFSAM